VPVRGVREAALASAAGEAGNVAPAAPAQDAGPEAARLLERARLLLELGNIVTERAALERAVESGSPQAAFALAETYDPVVLSAWGAVGTRGDPAKAQQLYARAAAGGVETARDRLDASRQPISGEARR
jgi:TPR repeat protein